MRERAGARWDVTKGSRERLRKGTLVNVCHMVDAYGRAEGSGVECLRKDTVLRVNDSWR